MAKQTNNSVEHRLDKIEDRLTSVEMGVHGIRSSIRTLEWILGLAGLALIGLMFFSGKSVVRDIAREVYREEFAFKTTISQDGKLTQQNAMSASDEDMTSIQFLWELQTQVDESKVTGIRAVLRNPLPGVAISAQLDDVGKTCVMTLSGPKEILADLPLPIDATVLIDVTR